MIGSPQTTPMGSHLVFVREDGSDGKNTIWICRCVCGKEFRIRAYRAHSGASTNCGCVSRKAIGPRSKTHGHSVGGASPTYRTWAQMRQRCERPDNRRYRTYGLRGIKVCDRWQRFENFLADMGEKPPGMSIDRIDNDRGYEPGNCRWATREQQARNTTKTKLNAVSVALIRHLRRRGETFERLADAFDVSMTTISSVCNGRTWR